MNVGGAGFTRTVVIGLFGGLVVGVFGREGGDALFNCRYVAIVEHEHMVVRKKWTSCDTKTWNDGTWVLQWSLPKITTYRDPWDIDGEKAAAEEASTTREAADFMVWAVRECSFVWGGWLWWGQWPFRGRELSHCEKRRSRSAAGPLIMTYESSTDAHRKKNHSQPLWSLWLHTDISQIGPNMMMMAHFILIFISDQGLRPFYLINVATSISRQARKDHSYCRSKEETDQLLPVFSSSHAAASWHHPLQVILRSSTDCHRGRFFPRCGRATWLLHESAVCRCCSCSCKWCVLSHIPWWTTDIIMTCLFGAMMMNYP